MGGFGTSPPSRQRRLTCYTTIPCSTGRWCGSVAIGYFEKIDVTVANALQTVVASGYFQHMGVEDRPRSLCWLLHDWLVHID